MLEVSQYCTRLSTHSVVVNAAVNSPRLKTSQESCMLVYFFMFLFRLSDMCVKWLQQDLVPVRHHLSSDAGKSCQTLEGWKRNIFNPTFYGICFMWENANCARDLPKYHLQNWPLFHTQHSHNQVQTLFTVNTAPYPIIQYFIHILPEEFQFFKEQTIDVSLTNTLQFSARPSKYQTTKGS